MAEPGDAMTYFETDPEGWERRRAADLEGRQCRPRICMGCGEETEEWWRRLGPTATAKFTSQRRRVVLCDDCVEDLTGRLTPKLISGGSVTQAETIQDLRLEIGEAKDLLGDGGDGTLKGRVESLLSELHLYRDVVEKARWWRDHPGAPGKKLIAALYELDAAEGRDIVLPASKSMTLPTGEKFSRHDLLEAFREPTEPDEDRSESERVDCCGFAGSNRCCENYQVSVEERAEEKARELASNAYHEHPSNPSTCRVYREHYGRPCICEDDWHHYLPGGEPRAIDLINEGYTARVEFGEVDGKHAVHFEHPDRVTITRRYTTQQCKVLEYVQECIRGKHPPIETVSKQATVKCTFCEREAITSDLDGNEVCKEHAVC